MNQANSLFDLSCAVADEVTNQTSQPTEDLKMSNAHTISQNNVNVNSNVSFASSQGKLPPGKYTATVVHAESTLRQPEGYHRVQVEFEITGPTYAGLRESKQYHLTTAKAAAFIKKEFAAVGVNDVGEDTLVESCEQMIGREVKIAVSYQPSGNKAIFITGTGCQAPVKTSYSDIWK